MTKKFYDLYYNVNKSRDDMEIIINYEYEKNENDYVNYDNFVKPNHYNGRKNDDVFLK